jgi:hypothetical protein
MVILVDSWRSMTGVWLDMKALKRANQMDPNIATANHCQQRCTSHASPTNQKHKLFGWLGVLLTRVVDHMLTGSRSCSRSVSDAINTFFDYAQFNFNFNFLIIACAHLYYIQIISLFRKTSFNYKFCNHFSKFFLLNFNGDLKNFQNTIFFFKKKKIKLFNFR